MIKYEFENVDADLVSPSDKIKTWLFDPPYNINFKYGKEVKDSMSEEDYVSFIENSVIKMYDNSLSDANLFLIIYSDTAARLLSTIEYTGWELKQWITWIYPSNMGTSKNHLTKAHRAVLWFTKGNPDAYIDSVKQPYRNPNDKRVKKLIESGKKGTNLYDWWEINLRKNVSKGYAGWYNQLPIELVRRIILLTTEKGDWVGDLMAGSGTLMEVGYPLSRNCYLNDIDKRSLSIWKTFEPVTLDRIYSALIDIRQFIPLLPVEEIKC